MAELTVSEPVKAALASLGGGKATGGITPANLPTNSAGPAPDSPALTLKVPVGDASAIDALRKVGLLVLPVSREQNQLEVSAVNAHGFTDSQAALLAKLARQIVWLKLGDTNISDAALPSIAGLKNLQKLHLERTHISDAGLKQLRALPYLEYLNLYGTNITDAGLVELASLKSLKAVYVWQTKATAAGIAGLKKELPGVDVIGGIDESAVATYAKTAK